ncbi:VWA domain-containing protein [candidate division CSSED10-310 bacterium]|uniref:VWA domain-containing protein n=1 Tax=candidate division CSSED10-310 bacterium TaxID=2855610 RepID=A0ABV6Z4A3_UNCC1
MILQQPIWLILLVPLSLSFWLWRRHSLLLFLLRLSILFLTVLAMCQLALILPSRDGTLVIIADRSLSMPAGSNRQQRECIELIQNVQKPGNSSVVISFAETATVEKTGQAGRFTGFITTVGGDQSRLAEALEKALSLIPHESPGRILLLSDGLWTNGDPEPVALKAALRNIALDFRCLQRFSGNELAIARVEAPRSVDPGEYYTITAWIDTGVSQDIEFELERNNVVLAGGERSLSPGMNRFMFRDKADKAGTYSYSLRVHSTDQSMPDPVPENNTAKFLVGITGHKPVLCFTSSPDSTLVSLLEAGKIETILWTQQSWQCSLEELSKYSGIVIENVPAARLGQRGMETVSSWVKDTGAGLLMTGGKGAYALGGYFRSPLEPILPVSMELRQEHRKFSLAIVVALDRSGSMAAPVDPGRTKMDLANISTAQVLDLLGPRDEFSVIAVDSSPHLIVPLSKVEEIPQAQAAIMHIGAMGGGIFIYEALTAAVKTLVSAMAGTRHIILFADAADAEQPGKYKELLLECQGANITVSVIGLGLPTDRDADLLRDIAARGGGQCFFTNDPHELPQLFAQDTFVLARNTFIEEPLTAKITTGMSLVSGQTMGKSFPLGGYNLCYLRPEAHLAAVSTDDYQAPIIAAWQAELGRVLCYTGELDGQFENSIIHWNKVGTLLSSATRWIKGEVNQLPGGMVLTQEISPGYNLIRLHLDPERTTDLPSGSPSITTLHGLPGARPQRIKTAMTWETADLLKAEIPLAGSDTSLSTVHIPGMTPIALAPVCLPYSPEYNLKGRNGRHILEKLARITAGKERLNLAGMWDDVPRKPRIIPISHWLLLGCIILFLFEILERRTGIISRLLSHGAVVSATLKMAGKKRKPIETRIIGKEKGSPLTPEKSAAEMVTSPPPQAEKEKSKTAGTPGIIDALQESKKRMKKRQQ